MLEALKKMKEIYEEMKKPGKSRNEDSSDEDVMDITGL